MEIPFTTEQFFEVIGKYNMTFFPVQLIFILFGIVAMGLIHSGKKWKNQFLGSYLGILWLWTGIAYHLFFFTAINKAAYVFGGLFVLQGLFFLMESFSSKRLEFEFRATAMHYVGYSFLIVAILIYPVLIYFLEGSVKTTITLGLPCPNTILTFGLLMFTTHRLRRYLLIIPFLWTLVGTSAAFNFGVYPDYFMGLSAVVAILYLMTRKKKQAV